jgi:hypothetical protein
VQVENQLPLIWIHRFLLFSFTRSEFSGFTWLLTRAIREIDSLLLVVDGRLYERATLYLSNLWFQYIEPVLLWCILFFDKCNVACWFWALGTACTHTRDQE